MKPKELERSRAFMGSRAGSSFKFGRCRCQGFSLKCHHEADGSNAKHFRAIARAAWTLTVVAFGVFAIAGPPSKNQIGPRKEKPTMILQLTSSAFLEGTEIPDQHTGEGMDISPPLKWTGVPSGAKSLALIADDPDAPMGTWVHWVLFDLPPATTELKEDVPKTQHLPGGAKQGLNDFKRLGYGGPCPPPGKPHRYYFKLYALDTVLDLKPGVTKQDVETAMKGHILAEGQLMGTYQRK